MTSWDKEKEIERLVRSRSPLAPAIVEAYLSDPEYVVRHTAAFAAIFLDTVSMSDSLARCLTTEFTFFRKAGPGAQPWGAVAISLGIR